MNAADSHDPTGATTVPVLPRDAATVLLLRPTDLGPFEVFMVKRHRGSAFMGGVHVFPGGKLDAEDSSADVLQRVRGCTPSAAVTRLDDSFDPARALGLHVAAIRETFEEANVFLGEARGGDRLPGATQPRPEDETFAAFLQKHDGFLRADRLVPWTRWITPLVEPKRFDTWFFLCIVAPGTEANHDGHETTEQAWFTPAAALAAQSAGTIALAPPTQRSLELLAACDTAEAAVAAASAQRPPRIQPHFSMEAGATILALPGDPTHPEPLAVIPGSTRFVLEGGRWWAK